MSLCSLCVSFGLCSRTIVSAPSPFLFAPLTDVLHPGARLFLCRRVCVLLAVWYCVESMLISSFSSFRHLIVSFQIVDVYMECSVPWILTRAGYPIGQVVYEIVSSNSSVFGICGASNWNGARHRPINTRWTGGRAAGGVSFFFFFCFVCRFEDEFRPCSVNQFSIWPLWTEFIVILLITIIAIMYDCASRPQLTTYGHPRILLTRPIGLYA